MNAALIPVRAVVGAKNRLGRELDERTRTRLTLAMLSDMICAARACRRLDAVYVVSADREVLSFAVEHGVEGLLECALEDRRHAVESVPASAAPFGGLNRAVHLAARALRDRGVRRLLTIPGDVPLVTAAEIDALFAATRAPVVLVRSASGTGTNGLLTSPPDVITPRFEGESLAAHSRLCEAERIRCQVVELSGFALDIDTFDDLGRLAIAGEGTESGRVAADVLAAHAQTAAADHPAYAARETSGSEP